MKRCPTCQKTYADTMRFCQIDGTPLDGETVESDDPYKTTVGGAPPRFEDDEDILGLSDERDSMDTVISLGVENPGFNQIRDDIKNDVSSFDAPTMPVSSPFDLDYQPPPSPNFGEPMPIKEPESPFGAAQTPFEQSPFDQNQNPFGQQMQQQWSPPPAPEASWQNQNIGANTPFQPPVAVQGQNQTLPIISLVCGVLAFVLICCYGGFPFGIAALITGFLGIQNFNKDPMNFGGKGLAIAGMILGGISFLLSVVFLIFGIALGAFGNLPG